MNIVAYDTIKNSLIFCFVFMLKRMLTSKLKGSIIRDVHFLCDELVVP